MEKNLILTGMMGVGKSTIGRSISRKMNIDFVDIDSVIEKKEKSTIQEIFRNKGEVYFRGIEKEITIQEIKKSKSVISLGGGTFIDKQIRDFVLRNCVSFWLDLKIEELEKRLKNSKKRPLLNIKNLPKTLKTIYLERKDTYKLANHKINCNNLGQQFITNKIIQLYESN